MAKIFERTEHRPWLLPSGPWIMAQSWHDLLFAHWAVDVAALRPLIPARLEIDLYDGRAWLGVVPFRMSGVRLRGTPAVPGLATFPELNVRTYVRVEGKPGVWFFSLDAANAIAVALARAWFHLPYFRARMECREVQGLVHYRSERTHRGALGAILEGRYRPAGAAFEPQPGTLEHFLTERYCLYSADSGGRVYRGEIHHLPWLLQRGDAHFTKNTMGEAAGVKLPTEGPLLHFAHRQDMVAWPPRRIL
jgi:uncharacterized protein